MPLTVEPLELRLKTPFRIAHGTSTARTNVLVRLGDGVGEGALPPYYPYTFEEVKAYLEDLDPDALLGDDPLALEDALDRLPPGPAPARTAVDLALHDHWGRQLGHPLYRLWGLNPTRAPLSSITLPIPEHLDDLPAQIQALAAFPLLKLKLGAGDPERDEAIVRAARETTDAQLCVDANSAWSLDEAVQIIPRLAAYDLLFVEQPLLRRPRRISPPGERSIRGDDDGTGLPHDTRPARAGRRQAYLITSKKVLSGLPITGRHRSSVNRHQCQMTDD